MGKETKKWEGKQKFFGKTLWTFPWGRKKPPAGKNRRAESFHL